MWLSAIITAFGSAMPCKRAARLRVSPTMPRSCAAPDPIRSPNNYQPGRDADAGLQRRMDNLRVRSLQQSVSNAARARLARRRPRVLVG